MVKRGRILEEGRAVSVSYGVKFLDEAGKDFEEILEYLSQFYPSSPSKFIHALGEKLSLLKENPYMYEAYFDHPMFRRAIAAGYLVFYRVDENTKMVEIYRILHETRDVKSFLP